MDVFTLCKEGSIKALYNELEAFRLQSGFTVSYDKTTLYRIGSLRHSDAKLYGLDQYIWSNKDITVLGVTIAHEQLLEKNYNGILKKVKDTVSAWQNRNLSLMGKVQVINSLVASQFVYKMMVLPCISRQTIKTVDNIIRGYLWNGRKAKIAYNILQLPKKEGGLNLVDLAIKDKALKATWPQILQKEDDYSQMVYGIMRCKTLKENIWRCTIHPGDVNSLKVKSSFWSDVLTSWCEYNYYQNSRVENQILWYNSSIKNWRKIIFLERLFRERLNLCISVI